MTAHSAMYDNRYGEGSLPRRSSSRSSNGSVEWLITPSLPPSVVAKLSPLQKSWYQEEIAFRNAARRLGETYSIHELMRLLRSGDPALRNFLMASRRADLTFRSAYGDTFSSRDAAFDSLLRGVASFGDIGDVVVEDMFG